MKKTLLLLSALALVLILAVVGLLLGFFSRLGQIGQPKADLERYLAENWPVFTLRSWDEETSALELDYPLRFSYEQMQKYGASLEELQALPEGNRATVAALKTAVREACGHSLRSVTVRGVTTDGQTAYTLHPDGRLETCWD